MIEDIIMAIICKRASDAAIRQRLQYDSLFRKTATAGGVAGDPYEDVLSAAGAKTRVQYDPDSDTAYKVYSGVKAQDAYSALSQLADKNEAGRALYSAIQNPGQVVTVMGNDGREYYVRHTGTSLELARPTEEVDWQLVLSNPVRRAQAQAQAQQPPDPMSTFMQQMMPYMMAMMWASAAPNMQLVPPMPPPWMFSPYPPAMAPWAMPTAPVFGHR